MWSSNFAPLYTLVTRTEIFYLCFPLRWYSQRTLFTDSVNVTGFFFHVGLGYITNAFIVKSECSATLIQKRISRHINYPVTFTSYLSTSFVVITA